MFVRLPIFANKQTTNHSTSRIHESMCCCCWCRIHTNRWYAVIHIYRNFIFTQGTTLNEWKTEIMTGASNTRLQHKNKGDDYDDNCVRKCLLMHANGKIWKLKWAKKHIFYNYGKLMWKDWVEQNTKKLPLSFCCRFFFLVFFLSVNIHAHTKSI